MKRYQNVSDRDMKSILGTDIDKKIQDKSIQLLVSQPICRPSSLNYLIHLLNKEKKPTEEKLKEIMSKALIAFVKHPHPSTQTENKIVRTISILRRNGADPHYQDQDGLSAFDYAYNDGKIIMLETLLCTYPKNPIRIIQNLLRNEQKYGKRPEILDLLRSIKRDFQTERGFSEYRTLYRLMPIEHLNIP